MEEEAQKFQRTIKWNLYFFSLHLPLSLSPSVAFKYLNCVISLLCKAKLHWMMDGILVCAQIHLSARYSVEADRRWDKEQWNCSGRDQENQAPSFPLLFFALSCPLVETPKRNFKAYNIGTELRSLQTWKTLKIRIIIKRTEKEDSHPLCDTLAQILNISVYIVFSI